MIEDSDFKEITPKPAKYSASPEHVASGVGSIGYMRIRTFSPERATLGPDGKMTTMLRAALKEFKDTDGLILDFRGNGGGLVAASDPFLGDLIPKTLRYAWGNAAGKKRVIRPRSPRYCGKLVALVDARSASGGEWAPRILRDAGRAFVIGERTAGAEAAVHTSEGPDGSKLMFSAWPMVEPGRKPFQEVGIDLDLEIPLTIEAARAMGIEGAEEEVLRARLAQALQQLQAPASHLGALLELAR